MGDTTLIFRVLSACVGGASLFHGRETPQGFCPHAHFCNQTHSDALSKRCLVCSNCSTNALRMGGWIMLLSLLQLREWLDSGATWQLPTEEGAWSRHLPFRDAHFAELWVHGTFPGVNRLTVIVMARGRMMAENWDTIPHLKDQGMGSRQWIWPWRTGKHWLWGECHSFSEYFLCLVLGCRETPCGLKWKRRTDDVWISNRLFRDYVTVR